MENRRITNKETDVKFLRKVIGEKNAYIENITKDIKDSRKENAELKEQLCHRQIKPVLDRDSIDAPSINCVIKHKGTQQPTRIFCERIEYVHEKKSGTFNHHLFFLNHGLLILKVWLPNDPKDKVFRDVFEALDSCGIKCIVSEDE